jgi:hypothetical protein
VDGGRGYYISELNSSWALHTYFYNHVSRLRLETLKTIIQKRYLELPRSPSGCFKALLDPGGGFRIRIEMAVTWPAIYNAR